MIFDATIKNILNEKLAELEKHFGADVVFYYGEIHPSLIRPFRDLIEDLIKDTTKAEKSDRPLLGRLIRRCGTARSMFRRLGIWTKLKSCSKRQKTAL